MNAPEAYPQGYVEDAFKVTCLREALRRRQGTQLADFFSIRLALGLCRGARRGTIEIGRQFRLVVYTGCIELGLRQA